MSLHRSTALRCLAAVATLGTAASPSHAQTSEKVLNLYSARHYQTDEALYSAFTKTTGITINRVDSDDAGIVARLRAEGWHIASAMCR